jgi:hypothetical protein
MRVELEETVKGVPSDALLLASWDDDVKSLKYTWPDKNGKWTRGGEMPSRPFRRQSCLPHGRAI